MKKTVLWSVLAVLFVVFIAGAVWLYNSLSENYVPEPIEQPEEITREKALDFVVYDINGTAVKLSDFKGRPVVVNFWASWCPPCKAEMPDFEAAYKQYGEDIQFLMVNMTDGGRETVSVAKAFLDSQNYSFPVYYDIDYSATVAYNVMSLPSSYFIDSNGCIAASTIGMINAKTLEKYIGMIK